MRGVTGSGPRLRCKRCRKIFVTIPCRMLRKFCSHACYHIAARRPAAALKNVGSGRDRARSQYKKLGTCEHCKAAPAVDRHHVDDNPLNNERLNVQFLCRRCHMDADGRLGANVPASRFGEAHPRATTTDAIAALIRQRYVKGRPGPKVGPPHSGSKEALAAEFGVSPGLVSRIGNGRGWRHV